MKKKDHNKMKDGKEVKLDLRGVFDKIRVSSFKMVGKNAASNAEVNASKMNHPIYLKQLN